MRKPVYLDYAATTPVDDRVAEAMMGCLTMAGNFANPASRSHMYGWKAEEAVEVARGELADLVAADPREIVWTSGATESNNLAIKGVAELERPSDVHFVTSLIEHKAVLDCFKHLESQGYKVTYLQPGRDGRVTADMVASALQPNTRLVSVMFVNNEIGVVNEIDAIARICREQGVLLHVDAAQAAGKIKIDVGELGADLMSFSAHKFYGPKGIGALYVRRKSQLKLAAQIHGGGHERGMRSGTLPTHQIVGMGAAAKIVGESLGEENARILWLRNRFLNGLCGLSGWQVNGSMDHRVAGNANVSFSGVDGEALLMSLRDLAVSTGSACTSFSVEPSYVLKVIGVSDALAHSSIRFSFGRYTTEDDVDFAAQTVCDTVSKLRGESSIASNPF
ncbi:cysteine desulfurase [Teredinibacter turnerae T7901]|uniref:cysteine desulfurase n=1 Tax=Teredinibacter turnerae (strain ATCC 39867 / T7901) TaxID=377629 RepID=C5BLX3_TERTT|nr:IscS subfamily cysteine desulfurase [Teredinibacter turnerae]ACR11884.1 cysteine desulfurase [Teredinibacter turnerae T7901]